MVLIRTFAITLSMFCGYPSSSCSAAQQRTRLFSEIITQFAYYFLGDIRAEYADYAYSDTQATLREGYDICDQEKAYIAQRAPAVRQALGNFLGQQIADGTVLPTIAFCCSGGGYRALLSSLGALKGAQEIGLYDAAVYNAGVSGGAWALAVLAQSGATPADCLEHVASAIDESLLDDFNGAQVEQVLLKQIAFTKRCSIVDFYGALLAQKMFQQFDGSHPSDITLAQQAGLLVPSQQPFPIYSSVFDAGNNNYQWVEFNPFEVSCVSLGSAIPTWAFGRSFDGGISTDTNPAQSLGYCMGIWGSSFTADIKDIANSYLPQISSAWLAYILGKLVQDMPDVVADERAINPALVRNWNYGTDLPYAQSVYLPLLDAGFMCDLPMLPLLRKARSINMIIVIDASEEANGLELRKAEQYARDNNILFPPIDYTQINLPCSVHADWSNPLIPVIVYFPLIAQAGYCNGWDPAQADFTSTFNFAYTHDQAMLLAGLMEYSIVQSQPILQDTINKLMMRMNATN